MLTTKVLSIQHKPSLVALGIALGTNLLNQFIVEPLSTDNMLRRYRMEEKGFTDSAAYKVRNSYLIVETTPCVSTNISVRHRDVWESFSRWIDRTIVNRLLSPTTWSILCTETQGFFWEVSRTVVFAEFDYTMCRNNPWLLSISCIATIASLAVIYVLWLYYLKYNPKTTLVHVPYSVVCC